MTDLSFVAPVVPTVSTRRKVAICVSMLLAAFSSSAVLFFTDHFNYADGANLGSTTGGGGAIWTSTSGDVSQIKVSTAATQTSPSGYATASGAMESGQQQPTFKSQWK